MSDKILQEIADNIGNMGDVSYSGLDIGFNDEAHNMLFYSLEQITVQLKRIADKMEAGQ